MTKSERPYRGERVHALFDLDESERRGQGQDGER